MSFPRPVFIVGNKRSGSTLLVNMLNEHPQVCITHESDIIWTLFQAREKAPEEFRGFPLDAPRGMEALIDAYGDCIKECLSPEPTPSRIVTAFFEVQQRVIEEGTKVHVPLKKADGLLCVGDKKPVQHAWPEIRSFLRQHFPQAFFIHVIRHPKAAVASKMEAARTWPIVPEYWTGSAAEVLDQWCIHEDWVLDLKASNPDVVYTIRLEDLVVQPAETMARLFGFLKLETSDPLLQRMAEYTYGQPNLKHKNSAFPLSARAMLIMEAYGYSLEAGQVF